MKPKAISHLYPKYEYIQDIIQICNLLDLTVHQIVDSDAVQSLGGNDDNLVVSKQHYRAIQIFEGADAISKCL